MAAYTIGLLLFALENLKGDKVKRRAKVIEVYAFIRAAALEPGTVLPKVLHGLTEKARNLGS